MVKIAGDLVDFDWSVLIPLVGRELRKVAASGAAQALVQVSIDDAGITSLANDDAIAWADVRTIGQDAVMVDDRRAAANATVDGAVKLADLRGRKVVTDSGELAGTIDGLDFDPETGTIAHYIVAGQSGGLFRTAPRYQLPPQAVAAVGDGLITVDARTIDFQRAPSPQSPPPSQS